MQYVKSSNHAPFEIEPIPLRMATRDESMVNGKYKCSQCGKVYSHLHQFHLHVKVHQIEGAVRCSLCDVSFNSKVQLQVKLIRMILFSVLLNCRNVQS